MSAASRISNWDWVELYVCPSDMAVASLAGRIAGYNNKIFVATAAINLVTYQTLNI